MSLSSDIFESAPRQENFGKFVAAGLVVSLLLHVGLIWWAWNYFPDRMGEAYFDTIVPRKFHVERVEVDPQVFQDHEQVEDALPARVVPVDLPPETVNFDHPLQSKPTPVPVDPVFLQETEQVEATDLAQAMSVAQGIPATDLVSDLESLREQLLETDPSSPARPALPLPEDQMLGRDAGSQAPEMRVGSMAGYSELDDLLGQTGPLEQGTAPIFMPGDLLFDYDEAGLRGGAIEVLRKLGVLIQRNPDTRFLIEGHTDSFGSAEYNQGLSERRALAVKSWLVEEMGIDESRIRTRGLGSTRLLAPASADIEGQRINRRVEIVLEVGD